MEIKGIDYLKNGMKIIKILYRLRDINDDLANPRYLAKQRNVAPLRRAAAKLNKELALLQKDQEKAESLENAKNNGLCKAFVKRKLSELEKRICFYLLTIMFDDMDNFRADVNEVKTVMKVVCADGLADHVDTLCDYILLGKLNKIDLFELQGAIGDKLFEKNLVPARCLIEAAVGSMIDDNDAPRYKNKKREMLSLIESPKNSSIHKPTITLGHVVLTPELRKKVDEFIWFYRKKSNKKSCWDLKELGLSTSNALFYGPPGTGKTMLAEAIAGELKLEIAKVRYEEIIDCWVGQSEKNIKKVFNTSGRRGSVVLFDECDAMLEARSSAKDSVDRMNNRIINIILQELERYQGIVIFTTNRAVELDEALGRRILLKMEIPRPGREERQEIWKKMTVGKVPLEEGIEWERVADHDLSGGEIKNVILNLAKDPDVNRPEVKVTTGHLLMAAEKEASGRLSGAKKKFGFDTN